MDFAFHFATRARIKEKGMRYERMNKRNRHVS